MQGAGCREKTKNERNEVRGTRFEGRLLSIDGEVASTWGRLLGAAERQGKRLPVMDSLIAATAITHNLTVITRNARDLERCQAKGFNPWKD